MTQREKGMRKRKVRTYDCALLLVPEALPPDLPPVILMEVCGVGKTESFCGGGNGIGRWALGRVWAWRRWMKRRVVGKAGDGAAYEGPAGRVVVREINLAALARKRDCPFGGGPA